MVHPRLAALVAFMTLLLPASALAQAQVLVIWDENNAGTAALVSALQVDGHSVTLSDTDEDSYDGTNPSTAGFDAVIHMCGTTYTSEMPTGGQQELVDFVSMGGGYIHTEWLAYEVDNQGFLALMEDLIILERSGGNSGTISYAVEAAQASHAVVANVPVTFSFSGGSSQGYARTYGVDPVTVLMTDDGGYDAVMVREWGAGRIVAFSHAANYTGYTTMTNTDILQLFVEGELQVLARMIASPL